jgi:hypothetical protein
VPAFVDRRLRAQRPEGLPHVLGHRSGFFPEGKVSASRELRKPDKIEVSLQQTLGRLEGQHLIGKVDGAGWNTDSCFEDWVVVDAAIESSARANSVGYQVDHHVREHLIPGENGSTPA